MKTFSRVIPVLALAWLIVLPASRAAEATPPPAEHEHPPMKHMRENRMKVLDETLHLTAEQKTQIQGIWDKAQVQVRALRDEQAAAAEGQRAKRRELMIAAHQQVRAVLTPEQQKLFDEMPPPSAHRPPPSDGEGR